ncbi:Zn-dependent protease/CBS domain-containing protein [Nocardioides ginsengisegetis]|uniref:Zinc metalloprotease n=1 Tax=Nocardioides ginsengisegetis TaxID=661491 RepID=A0A7W3IZG8_9ACTN|nr:site-2 protease family protein [Nocardioides ginsengisegetis]MBA8803419.1 Zn-dependent protease/CBS domain-containing protein [Nocardioides ginsengisegetis]
MSIGKADGRAVHPATGGARGDTPFGAGAPLGRWFGVPVRAHLSVLVAMALFAVLIATVEMPATLPDSSVSSYWAASVVMAPLFFATLLAHEVAHAVTARHYGIRVRRITLWMLGGLTELEGEAPDPRADAVIAAAGPATSLAIGAVCAASAWLTSGWTLVSAALNWLAGINVLLGVFNLLPGAPLDGGRILRATLWWRGHDREAAAAKAARAGRILGMILVGLGVVEVFAGAVLGLWTALIGWFILNGAATEGYAVRAESLAGLTVRDAMTATPQVFPDWSTVAEFFARISPDAARQGIFPLIDIDGGLSGAVTLPMLTTIARDRIATTRLRDVSPRQALLTTTPAQDLSALLLPLHLRGGIAIVLDQGHPVGVVTDGDLARLAAIARGRSTATGA